MALADTVNAVGMVSKVLEVNFAKYTEIQDINVGRPQQAAEKGENINIFLYEISFDPFLKNTPLNEGERPPLWLVLKYLVTVFSGDKLSDSIEAHKMLGKVIRAISRDDFLTLRHLPPGEIPNAEKALGPNPSSLHVTFDESPSDLIAKLMQGPDDNFRLSVSFQVRPVLIAPAEPGDYSLLVGVDYTKPPIALTPHPVGLDVVPSMGSFISEILPAGFEVGEEVTILGTDLHLANLSVMLGPVELPVTAQQPDQLRFTIDPALIGASGISAGSHPVTVVLTLPGSGKKRSSNSVIGNLVPTLSTAAPVLPVTVAGGKATATIDLGGKLLGSETDDVVLAFYRDGSVLKMFDVFTALPVPQPPLQPSRQLVMSAPDDAVPVGNYNMILLVNGQQAPQSPIVSLV
jgi:hypothetical protein